MNNTKLSYMLTMSLYIIGCSTFTVSQHDYNSVGLLVLAPVKYRYIYIYPSETGGIAIVLDPPEKTNPVPSRFPPGPFFGVAPFVDVMTDEHKVNGCT